MQSHPYANLFPMMDRETLRELTASVRDDGLEQPIITLDGKILDGRNRALACANAKVKPVYAEYEGDDPLGYVLRTNLHRRHLTTSQRAAVAAELANMKVGKPEANSANLQDNVSSADAAEALNVSERSVNAARKVKEADPELHEAVKAGEVSVSAAEKQVRNVPEKNPSEQWRHAIERMIDKAPTADDVLWLYEQLSALQEKTK